MNRAWNEVLREHEQVIAALADQAAVLDRITAVIAECLRSGRHVYTLGNGGSAADAQHIACELLGRFKRERAALPALALTTDTSTLTAIANDLGYERVFARQIEGLVQPGDVVWALSGGKLAGLCTHVFHAPHTSSDRIQEAHGLAYHYLCERVEAALSG
jgi:D-sedoheptulose 7-phosphate isomerase